MNVKESEPGGGYTLEYENREIDNIQAELIDLKQCSINTVTGGTVKMNQSGSVLVAAEKVECEKSGAVVLIAQEVHGDCRPIFSLPAALVIAGAFLLGIAFFKRK